MTPQPSTTASPPGSGTHWLDTYPGHLARTWTLAYGEVLSVRPVRHDDGALEEAFVRGLPANVEPEDATVVRIRRDLAAGNTQLR